MQDQKENSRKELIEKLTGLHNQFGFNVRFNSGGDGGDGGDGSDGGDGGDGLGGDSGGAFTIPDKYKEKAYLKDVNSLDELFTKLDGAESLIGKNRTVLPDETSTPDDIAAFHESRGVLKDHNDYKSTNTEEGADNSFFDKMKPLFKKAHMTQADVSIFQDGLKPILEEITGKKLSDDNTNDEEFVTLTTKIFGDTKDDDLAQAKALLSANTPEGMKEHMANLDNRSLIIMASALKHVRAKYINEGGMGGAGGNVGGSSAEHYRNEAKKQIAIAQDPNSSMQQKEDAAKKANEFYEKYAVIVDKK